MMKYSTSNESDIDVHLVFSRMLDVLGLKMHVCDAPSIYGWNNYHYWFIFDVAKPLIRQFMNNGKVFLWKNDCDTKCKFHSKEYEINGGNWTIFRNDDYAMFQLFTEYIEQWSFESAYLNKNLNKNGILVLHNVPRFEDIHFNPFYGCKSFEEVLIKCDLLGC